MTLNNRLCAIKSPSFKIDFFDLFSHKLSNYICINCFEIRFHHKVVKLIYLKRAEHLEVQ